MLESPLEEHSRCSLPQTPFINHDPQRHVRFMILHETLNWKKKVRNFPWKSSYYAREPWSFQEFTNCRHGAFYVPHERYKSGIHGVHGWPPSQLCPNFGLLSFDCRTWSVAGMKHAWNVTQKTFSRHTRCSLIAFTVKIMAHALPSA